MKRKNLVETASRKGRTIEWLPGRGTQSDEFSRSGARAKRVKDISISHSICWSCCLPCNFCDDRSRTLSEIKDVSRGVACEETIPWIRDTNTSPMLIAGRKPVYWAPPWKRHGKYPHREAAETKLANWKTRRTLLNAATQLRVPPFGQGRASRTKDNRRKFTECLMNGIRVRVRGK